jgi:hypothetical protein
MALEPSALPVSAAQVPEEEIMDEEEFYEEEIGEPVMQQPGFGNGRHHAETQPQQQPQAQRRPAPSRSAAGELVSYVDDPRGSAIELRSGRFFLGSRQLRASDVIIPHESVSAPHCLVKADRRGVELQDLMSEEGTFVKKSGQADFEQIEESVTLSNGDRIRMGSYELLVCLLPR